MKTAICLSITALLALPAWAADLSSEVKSAAQKLADQSNYSWSSKTENARQSQQGGQAQGQGQGRGQGRGGAGFGAPPSGKTEKDGFTVLTYKNGENTTEAILKGGKVALKSEDEWKTAEELADAGDAGGGGGGGNRSRFMARRVQSTKLPATEAQELAGRVTDWKKEGDVYSGSLSKEGLKEMYTFRGRQGGGGGGGEGNAPDTSGLHGTAKFWVKDGVLTKYESHVEGKMSGRNNRETEVNRTTTTEVKDLGTTKLEVPAEAKKKLKQ